MSRQRHNEPRSRARSKRFALPAYFVRGSCARGLLLAIACLIAGCSSQSAPAPSAPPQPVAARVLSEDEKVLLALDYYDPMYKLDAQGRVTHLKMSGKHLPTAVVAEIGKLTQLQGFGCDWTTITDDGVAQLKNLKNLRSIGLTGTAVTDKTLTHLEALPSLRWTWVPRNNVTQPALDALKEARPDLNVYPQ